MTYKQLQKAIKENNLEALKLLISLSASKVEDCNDAVYIASDYGNLEIVKYLINYSHLVSFAHIDVESAVFVASGHGRLETVMYLISCVANNFDLGRVVAFASENGHLDIVKYLVSHGANIRHEYDHAVRFASINGHFETVKYLISLGADIGASDDFAVKYACMHLHLDAPKFLKIIRFLILENANVDAICDNLVNELVILSYNSGDFVYATKLSQHKYYTNDTIKKSLTKIQQNRDFFTECISSKNKFTNVCVITHKS